MILHLYGDLNLAGCARALGAEFSVPEPGFNTWRTAIFDPASSLYAAGAAAHIFCLSPRILAEDDFEDTLKSALARLELTPPRAPVLFANFVADPLGVPAFHARLSEERLAARLNEALFDAESRNLWFNVLDLAGLVTEHGLKTLTDPRFEAAGRLFFNPRGAALVAGQISRTVRALKMPGRKVLVVDLDNTLWGGVLGEDGVDGILLGGDGAGYAFLRFQRALKRLKNDGVLLALASKNNESEVRQAFADHPDIALKLDDFAAHRINWRPKPENIKEMAVELNLGLESFVFIDDSKFECEAVRQAHPEVDVLEVPGDPAQMLAMLSAYPGFDRLRVTGEDRTRARLYAEDARRQEIRRGSRSLEEFYRSLEMRAHINRVNAQSLGRAYQLIHKTNQFNLTTERLSEPELSERARDPEALVLTLSLSDRMGESGLTGLVLLRTRGPAWSIENLMLSCRILGRTVEFALMRALIARAKRAHATTLRARFLPSARNQVAADYLERCGFAPIGDDAWEFNLETSVLPADFVDVKDDA